MLSRALFSLGGRMLSLGSGRVLANVTNSTGSTIAALAGPARPSLLRQLLPPLLALGSAAALSTLASQAAGGKESFPQAPLEVTGLSVSYPPHGRAIFVGDVHGCAQELIDLMNAVDFTEDDLLVLVGDLIGKGPDSEGVIKLARALGPQCVALRGNHDQVRFYLIT